MGQLVREEDLDRLQASLRSLASELKVLDECGCQLAAIYLSQAVHALETDLKAAGAELPLDPS